MQTGEQIVSLNVSGLRGNFKDTFVLDVHRSSYIPEEELMTGAIICRADEPCSDLL